MRIKENGTKLLLKCLLIGESSTEEVAIRGVSSVVDVFSEGDGVLVTEHQRERAFPDGDTESSCEKKKNSTESGSS